MGESREGRKNGERWLRDYYDVRSSNPGGFAFVRPEQLLLPYWARRHSRLSSLAFRLYYAAVEIAKRRQGTNGRVKLNSVAEACALTGCTNASALRRAARELVESGLIRWERERIEFASENEVDGLGDLSGYFDMMSRVGRCVRRKLAVPMSRRVLVAIARGEWDAVGAIAVVFGVSLRCVRRRRVNGKHVTVSGGLCSTAWIAEAFDVGHSTVKRWISKLGDGGESWLHRLPTPQWMQQRWGARTVVNLDWQAAEHEVRPRSGRVEGQVRPPYEDQDLSSKVRTNQDRRRRDKLGFEKSSKRTWRIASPEMKTVSGVLASYQRARECGLLDGVEEPRVSFVAGAMRARRIAARRGGCAARLFAWMVHRRMWHFLKWEEECEARERLNGRRRESEGREGNPTKPSPVATTVSELMSSLSGLQTAA